MGVFFVSRSAVRATAAEGGERSVSWPRLVFALVVLGVVLAVAIATAEPENAPDRQFVELHGALVNGFQLLLGTLIGLLTGEALSQG